MTQATIAEHLASLGIRPGVIAKRTGASPQTVTNWLRGMIPGEAYADALSELLGLTRSEYDLALGASRRWRKEHGVKATEPRVSRDVEEALGELRVAVAALAADVQRLRAERGK